MWRAFSSSADLQNAWPTSSSSGSSEPLSPSPPLLPPTAFSPLLKCSLLSLGYHHSVPSAVTSPPETVRRKRGRPRKYGTSEQALSAKKASSSSPVSKKKEQGLASSSKSSQLLSLGGFLQRLASLFWVCFQCFGFVRGVVLGSHCV